MLGFQVPVPGRPFASVSAALAGLLAEAMLFLRVVLLPFWQGAPPAELRAWFAANAERIRALMLPLGVASAAANVGGRAGAGR